MSASDGALVVLCTAPSADEAARLARAVVDAHLVACVNLISPIRSIYRFRDEVHDEAEHLMVLKTTEDRFEELRAFLLANHPYEVPEVLALPVSAGSPAYLEWLVAETRAR